ncbi:proline racemase family protein [Aquisalibacillus elongatus]|uniref:Proline racemase n=1 Tax=Aquisalibacillus elongatus TaxID=485577 RepID=A0A3N5B4J0_9BACI|nr:proline racemase family protein [Aquisalibacillus elongatus]RPF52187.1 proline racemase [Aquisalibacillus elongatus]
MNLTKMYSTIDTHVDGEAFRIVTHSPIGLTSTNIVENQNKLNQSFTQVKEILLNEPRGHRGMNGCLTLPSNHSDFGLLFFTHNGSATFKIGALIATTVSLIETGNLEVKPNGKYKIETYLGVYQLEVEFNRGTVLRVLIENKDTEKLVQDNWVVIDGGRRYRIFSLPEEIPAIEMDYLTTLKRWGKDKVNELNLNHEKYDGIILVENKNLDEYRTMTFENDGHILRSPGIDSTMALLIQKDLLNITNYNIFGNSISAKKQHNSLEIELKNKVFITSVSEFVLDEDDPLRNGFIIK